MDLNHSYDWNVMEDLKARLCTLGDSDVALNLYDFIVRRPNKLTEKYGLRAYDEIILAPMCLFEPRVIEFESKRENFHPIGQNVTEEIIGHPGDVVTNAMVISTQHLMPNAESEPLTTPGPEPTVQPKVEADAQAMDVDLGRPAENQVVDVEEDTKVPVSQSEQTCQPSQAQPAPSYPGGYAIDVCFEASKLPLDVAIFNSARAAGGDEKIRKYLQAVLVIGGSALIPGMAHALESRLQAIATPLVPNMEKVQIIPPPKEVDPRVLTWKGAAVLGKMEGISDLWVTLSDWNMFGVRALKERCYYL